MQGNSMAAVTAGHAGQVVNSIKPQLRDSDIYIRQLVLVMLELHLEIISQYTRAVGSQQAPASPCSLIELVSFPKKRRGRAL